MNAAEKDREYPREALKDLVLETKMRIAIPSTKCIIRKIMKTKKGKYVMMKKQFSYLIGGLFTFRYGATTLDRMNKTEKFVWFDRIIARFAPYINDHDVFRDILNTLLYCENNNINDLVDITNKYMMPPIEEADLRATYQATLQDLLSQRVRGVQVRYRG